MEGSIYTVDEVSDLLGIPRPTLYRYLREYSIPHLRRAGRIRIPEDSFDRIREARDLHKEGLVTETVRRQLREGAAPDTNELDRRLDSLHDTLQNLRGDLRERPATDEVALSPTLRTVLARQSLMLSAMFNLTGMVEDLLTASGKPRRPLFEDLRPEPVGIALVNEPAERRLRIPVATTVHPEPDVKATLPTSAQTGPAGPDRVGLPTNFGSLRRRRRAGAVAVLCALLICACLAFLLPNLGAGDEIETAGQKTPANPVREAAAPQDGGAPEGSAEEVARDANAGGAAQEIDQGEGAGGATPEQAPVGEASAADASEGGIPDVSGRNLEEAARAVFEAGFSVAAIRTEVSRAEPGTVTSIEPAAGTDARSGAPVFLTMSGGADGVASAPSSASAAAGSSSSASASAPASVSAGASASPGP